MEVASSNKSSSSNIEKTNSAARALARLDAATNRAEGVEAKQSLFRGQEAGVKSKNNLRPLTLQEVADIEREEAHQRRRARFVQVAEEERLRAVVRRQEQRQKKLGGEKRALPHIKPLDSDALRLLEARCNEATRLARREAATARSPSASFSSFRAQDRAYTGSDLVFLQGLQRSYDDLSLYEDHHPAASNSSLRGRRAGSQSPRAAKLQAARVRQQQEATVPYHDPKVDDLNRRLKQSMVHLNRFKASAPPRPSLPSAVLHFSPPPSSSRRGVKEEEQASEEQVEVNQDLGAYPSAEDNNLNETEEEDDDTQWYAMAESGGSESPYAGPTNNNNKDSLYDIAFATSPDFFLSPSHDKQPPSSPPAGRQTELGQLQSELGQVRELLFSAGASLREAKRWSTSSNAFPSKEDIPQEQQQEQAIPPESSPPPRYWSIEPAAFSHRGEEEGKSDKNLAVRHQPRPSLIQRLTTGQRLIPVDSIEMRERTKRSFDRLPESVEARKALERRVEAEAARLRAKEFARSLVLPAAAQSSQQQQQRSRADTT